MNQVNYQFLVETLERHGLSHPAINNALKTKMTLGSEEFDIGGMKLMFGKDEMRFTAKFGKGESRGNDEGFYYLNKFKATITKENGQTHTAEFALYKQKGFNTNEMFNLMDGRPVYKKPRNEEGRWMKVDFKNVDENGFARMRSYYDSTTNFNLPRELEKLPVVYAKTQDKENTILDLQRGERVSAAMKIDGKRDIVNIGVSPQLGGLTLYDADMKPIKHTNSQSIEMVLEDDLSKNMGKKNDKLPEQTVELMNKINNSKQNEGQGQNKKIS